MAGRESPAFFVGMFSLLLGIATFSDHRFKGGVLTLNFILLLLARQAGNQLSSTKISGRIKRGDKQAFHTFFEAYYDPLIRFLQARGIARQTAKDLIQNAFVYIWEHRNEIDETKSLRSYLYRIAYTRMLNHVKYQERFDSDAAPEDESASVDHPEEVLKAKDLLDVVQAAIDQMPEKRKAVFELCFMQEFTYRETAKMMEISKNTVENHMAKAFRDVRSAVNNFYEFNHLSG